MRRALSLPIFRRLLAAYLLNELAWSVGTVALSVLVYVRTGSAVGSAGFFISSQVLPALVAPALVARLARVPARRALPAVYGIEALLFGVLAWMTAHFSPPAVLAVVLVDGTIAITARALASTARTEVLRPVDLLPEGNAVTSFGFSAAFMCGPVIGGAVVAAGGTVAALLVNCGLFAAMALLLAATALPAAETEAGSAWSRLRGGIAHAREDRPLGRLLSLQALGFVCFTIAIPVEVVYAQHTLGAGADGYGILLGAWGAGAVGGSVAYARWRRRPAGLLIGASAAALGVGYAALALAPSLGPALAGAAVAGAGNSVWWVAMRTSIQERTPDRWMAVTLGLSEAIAQFAPGVGILLGGALAALASTRTAFAASAAGALLVCVAAGALLGVAPARPAADREPASGQPPAADPAAASAQPPAADLAAASAQSPGAAGSIAPGAATRGPGPTAQQPVSGANPAR